MFDDIKFIKTNKVGSSLTEIQKEYPNSIINVDSESEKNIYIGSNRVTDNYNLRVNENSTTNNVGGMVSGINASDLKGKSVSEILDIILFAENNNLTLKGVMVVEHISNLTDNTLSDVYQGMVVSVVEDNSLYVLLTEPNEKREWKKVGSDIDIEEIKVYSKKLSAPITVAGLSGSLGANISNGKIYTTDNTIEDILRDLLCKELYPSVSLSTTNPTITFGGLSGAEASNRESIMRVGSVLNLNSVTLGVATISNCYRRGNGFAYGYSVDNDGKKDGGEPPIKYGTSSLVGDYSLKEVYEPSTIGTERTTISSNDYKNVKFDAGRVTIGLGSNTISFTATSPSGVYSHPEYPEYYIVSNLGNTDVNKKLSSADGIDGTLSSVTDNEIISVTGVYPVYVNISSGNFVDDTVEMTLTASKQFEFNVPSEVSSGIHFTFDYPATHDVTNFEIKDLTGKFVKYDATYESESEIITKNIEGNNISYKRFVTTGKLQGEGTYRITLSKGLDK